MRRSWAFALALTLGIAASPDALAQRKPPSQKNAHKKSHTSLWDKLKGGDDLIDAAPTAAVFDGMWSLFVHYATELTNRTWDAPYPWGTIGQYSTRILYGFSWTGMLAIESAILLGATGGTWEWVDEATYRDDWMITTDAPVCPRSGAYGGCGLGVGDFAFLQFRPKGTKWWFEAGGGWIQQRIYNDQFRTVAESSSVLTPVSATYEFKTDPEAPIAAKMYAGPGLYFGLHNGHMHETLRGQREKNLRAPWHEMYLLDWGLGLGARVDGRIIFFRRFGLDAELTFAPLLLGGPTSDRPSTDISPLDFERQGFSVWRKGLTGISWNDPTRPLRPVLAVFAAELSDRNVFLAGHRGVMLRFDIALRGPGAGN